MSGCIWYVSKYVLTPSAGDPVGRGYGFMREFARMGYRTLIITSDSMGKFNAPLAPSLRHRRTRGDHCMPGPYV